MTIKSMTPRTPVQKTMAAVNGRKSLGPRTEDGKNRSSMNATKHGARARRVLLAGESIDVYLAEAKVWVESLEPCTDAETELVLDIVDVRVCLSRIEAAERRMVEGEVARAMEEMKEALRLKIEAAATTALTTLASVVDSTRPTSVKQLDDLLPAVQKVIALVKQAEELHEMPVQGLPQLEAAVIDLVSYSGEEWPEKVFQSLSSLAQVVVDDLLVRKEQDERLVSTIESSMLEGAIPKNSAERRRLDSYRRQLQRRLQAHFDLFEQLRNLRPASSSGSFVRPVLVSLRAGPPATAVAHG